MIRTLPQAEEVPFDAEAAMTAAQEGNATAFGEIYGHLAPDIHGHLLQLSRGNEALAEDFTQDTFMRAFQSMHAYKTGSVKKWLYTIATNRYIDEFRFQQRHPRESADILVDVPDKERPFDDITATRAELGAYIAEVIQDMNPDFVDVVVAIDGNGHTYKEVAEVFGITTGTVRSRAHRGRRAFWEHPKHGYQYKERPQNHNKNKLVQNADGAGGDERDDDE